MCVFLSAGVGRTGVFITLSIVLERMRYEGVVDLFQTVKTLRTQRPAMVQTEVRTTQGQGQGRESHRDGTGLKVSVVYSECVNTMLSQCPFGVKLL